MGNQRQDFVFFDAMVARCQSIDHPAQVAQQGRQARQTFGARRHVERQQAGRGLPTDMGKPGPDQFAERCPQLRQESPFAPAQIGLVEAGRRRSPQRRQAGGPAHGGNRQQMEELAFLGGNLRDHAGETGADDPAATRPQFGQADHQRPALPVPFGLDHRHAGRLAHGANPGSLEQRVARAGQQIGERVRCAAGFVARGGNDVCVRNGLFAQPQHRRQDVLAHAGRRTIAARLLRPLAVEFDALPIGLDDAALRPLFQPAQLARLDILVGTAQQPRIGERGQGIVVVGATGENPVHVSRTPRSTGKPAGFCQALKDGS